MTTDWSWIHSIDATDAELYGAASEQDVRAAESAIGSFPPEYRGFVLAVGSARVYHREYFGVHPGVSPEVDVVDNTLTERTMTVDRPLPAHLIAVYNDGGGNIYCVKVDVGDESDSHRNAVYAWWHDDDSEPELMDESFAHWVRSDYETYD